ncbi:MAG TPA: glycosyltransferase [Acidobacteriaceae bacterium]|jgi:glycosyltransferase involved in cell wall biosynthesis
MPNVLIFRELLLPPSETFVLAQAAALNRYRPVFCGLTDVPQSLPVPRPIRFTSMDAPLARYRIEFYRRLQWGPFFHQRMRRAHPTLIHSHFAIDGADALGMQSSLQIPMVVTLHGFDVSTSDENLARNRSGRRFLKRRPQLWKAASKFVCVSKAIREIALRAGYPDEKLIVRYIGIDCQKFAAAPARSREENLILFVARLVEKKGCEYLIRAIAQLRERRRDTRLVVIGDGPLRGELEQLAGSLRVPAKFLGVQGPDAVRDWMQRAWVLSNPSVTAANGDTEGLGMVFAEAQATGLPVVSTRHGGIPEVVRDGETGLLASERSVEELASHLERMLMDRTFWNACSERAKLWVREQFDIRRCTAGLEEVYDAAVARGQA